MKLFDHEKDSVLKITNLVLLVWLISAITLFHIAVVDVVMPNHIISYVEYESLYCAPEHDVESIKYNCNEQYEREKLFQDEHVTRRQKSIFISLGNIIIVSFGMYLLNKNKK